MRRVIRAIVRHNAPRLRKRALVETQLAGYEAWFSDETKFRAFAEMLSGDDKGPAPLNKGYVLTDRWVYYGDKNYLKSLLLDEIDADSTRNEELRRDLQTFRKEVGIRPAFIVVGWRTFFESIVDRPVYRHLERLYPDRKVRAKILKELLRGKYPVPQNRQQAEFWAEANLRMAIVSLIDRVVVAGQSNGEGIRLQGRIELGKPKGNDQ